MTTLEVSGDGDLLGVERVVSLLRQRGYAVRRLRVDWSDDLPTAWTLRCAVTGADRGLLAARLERAVSVLDVRFDDTKESA